MEANITKIGKYEIVGVLGKGAMGVVYQGFDPMIRRHVAIKTMAIPSSGQALEQDQLRFQREAQAAGNLNHPNIVAIHEYGNVDGMAYIVMEYVQGETLAARMKRADSMTAEQAVQITRQVLSALAHAHAMGVVHRDIKPANIILSPQGTVKVTDFGIARIELSDLTKVGTIMGTPGYMSPEQLKGESIDHRTDLFSTGVVLYEMLTGQKAFGGSTIASVIYKVINEELPSPSQIKADLPAGLDDAVARAVAKNRDLRFDSATAFDEALEHAAAQASAVSDPFGPRAVPAKQTSRLGLWAATAFLIAVAAGLAAWYMVTDHKVPKTVTSRRLAGQVFADCDFCPSMVVIAPQPRLQKTAMGGAFGGGQARPLAVGRFEITRSQYARFAAETGLPDTDCAVYDGQWRPRPQKNWQSPGYTQADDHPVVCVSWEDARAYVDWLSNKTGRTYRLLSAAEWEYLALAGQGRAFPVDPDQACRLGNVADMTAADRYPGWEVFNCRDNYIHSAPVGSFQANDLGIFDLAGNVFEWVADCWEAAGPAPGQDHPQSAGEGCEQRQLRGGSWYSRPRYVNASFRNHAKADYRSSSFGFRVARELAP